MIVGGPFVAAVGAIYIFWTLGPSAMFGILTFIMFYPIQYGISTLAGELQ